MVLITPNLIGKDPDAGKEWRQKEKGKTEDEMVGWHHWLNQWTWVWASFGSWWWTEKPGVLQSMGLQRVRHNWAAELNQTPNLYWALFFQGTTQGTISAQSHVILRKKLYRLTMIILILQLMKLRFREVNYWQNWNVWMNQNLRC